MVENLHSPVDPDSESVQTDATVAPEELKSVKELLQALAKTAKTVKIYLSNNPIHQKFLKELTEKFAAHLENFGPLDLKVQQYQFLYQGEIVYENTNRLESFAFKMHIDGVREISFLEGLEQEEIINLIDIFSRDFDANNPNDDMVTLLWEKHFTHVSYAIADEFFDEDTIQNVDQKQSEENPEVVKKRQELLKEEIQSSSALFETDGIKRFDRPYSQIFQLSEEEIGRVKQLMEIEEKRDLRTEIIVILGSILKIEKEDRAFDECLKALQKILGILIAQGDFSHACKVLEVYREIIHRVPPPSPCHLDHLEKSLEWAGGPENFKEIESLLKVGNLEDTEAFSRFLSFLGPNAIPELVRVLGTLNQMKVRRLVCESLAVLGKDNLHLFKEGLKDSRWYVVRNIVYVLGKIGDPKGLEDLKRLARHPEVRVRKEVVQALHNMPFDRVEPIFITMLNDSDVMIRQQALRWLSASGTSGSLKVLREIVEAEPFQEKNVKEKQEYLDTIAKLGGDSIIDFLKSFIRMKKSFLFSNQKKDEISICAISSLKKINSDSAIGVLEEGMGSPNKLTKEACKKALEEARREKLKR